MSLIWCLEFGICSTPSYHPHVARHIKNFSHKSAFNSQLSIQCFFTRWRLIIIIIIIIKFMRLLLLYVAFISNYLSLFLVSCARCITIIVFNVAYENLSYSFRTLLLECMCITPNNFDCIRFSIDKLPAIHQFYSISSNIPSSLKLNGDEKN